MAYASGHDEEMKYFMRAEFSVFGVEQRKLQSIDDSSYGVDNAPCQEPQKCRRGECVEQSAEHQHTDPAHGDIDNRGKPFGTGNPEGLDQHSCQSNTPHKGQ